MTSLAVWASVDSHGISSVYIMTDSRITWSAPSTLPTTWDFATKVFYCRNTSDIFGYSGSSLAVVKILSQITSVADTDGLFSKESTAEERANIFSTLLKTSLQTFPVSQFGEHISTIVHCSQTIFNKPVPIDYSIRSITFTGKDVENRTWREETYNIPTESKLIKAWGSGAQYIEAANSKWKSSEIGGTSRAVFSSIIDAIRDTKDINTGGAPQLVGIYRYHLPKLFGLIYKDKLFVNGLEISEQKYLDNIEWRNELFEVCDWNTKRKTLSAKGHHRPKCTI